MKCMTCNECSDKKFCAILNGLIKVPYPLIAFKIKGCHERFIDQLNKIKELAEYFVTKHLTTK